MKCYGVVRLSECTSASLGTSAMPMNKPHLEFHRLDLASGWETMHGYPPTIRRKVLASERGCGPYEFHYYDDCRR